MDRFAEMAVFVRVLDAGSFSTAARQLRKTQSAVSKTVAQLEQRLDTRLLLRSTHGLAPTQAGLAFCEQARRALSCVEDAELAARGSGAGLSGPLRVAAAVTFGRLHVVPHLGRFLAKHPAMEIDLLLDDATVDLVQAGIDVAFRMGDLADSALTAMNLAHARRLVIATPAYFADAGEPRHPADLAAHRAVIYGRGGGGTAWRFRRGAETTDVSIAGPISITAAEGVRAAVLAGLGFTIASEWMFAPELHSGEVRAALTDWTLPSLGLSAVYPGGRQAGAKARAFVAFLQHALNTPGLGSGRACAETSVYGQNEPEAMHRRDG